MSAQPAQQHRVTTSDLQRAKNVRPITMCTAYDYHSARLVDGAGIDTILVGDSLGMTMLGYDSTVPVTMEDVLTFTRIVTRSTHHAFVIADMPFMSYRLSHEKSLENATRLMQEGGAQAVKFEGAGPRITTLVTALKEGGIPVVAHLGLTPQSVNVFGGYKVQGKTDAAAAQLLADAHALEDAGAIMLVLECIPAALAERVTRELSIPTIGIGAGPACDGQVQVFHDLMGYGTFTPRHAKNYAHAEETFARALATYKEEVEAGQFPTQEQSS